MAPHSKRVLISKMNSWSLFGLSRWVVGAAFFILLVLIASAALVSSEFSGYLNLPIHSVNEADYRAIAESFIFPEVGIGIVGEVLEDQFPNDPRNHLRLTEVNMGLLTPVSTSTPRFTPTDVGAPQNQHGETKVLNQPSLSPTLPDKAVLSTTITPNLSATVHATNAGKLSPSATVTRTSIYTQTATRTPTLPQTATRTSTPLLTATRTSTLLATATSTPLPSPTNTVHVNRAPVISGLPSQTTPANSLYYYKPSASDPDGNTLAFSITNKPEWADFNPSDGSLTGTPTNIHAGTSSITITVSDGSLSASFVISLTVTYTNQAPVLTGEITQVINADSAYSFTPIASDPDNDPLLFSIENKPTWAVFDSSSGKLSGTPGNPDSGTSIITISASDGLLSGSFTYALTVTYTNHAPAISGPDAQVAPADQIYSFVPVVTDIDADTLTFSIENKPVWMDFNATNGMLSGTPNNSHVGMTEIAVTVSDGQLSDRYTFVLTVSYTNHSPVIDGPTTQTVAADSLYSFIPTASDMDGDALSFSILNKPDWATFNTIDGSLTGVPVNANTGVSDITIEVSDSELSASLTFRLSVTYTNHAPVISGDIDQSAAANSFYMFTPISSDPDGDPLTFAITNKPDWAAFDSLSGTISGTPTNADSGTTNITISVSDGLLSTDLAIALTITYTTVNPICVTVPAGSEGSTPVADSYLDKRQPNAMNGAEMRIKVRFDTAGDMKNSLIKFDLGSIPLGTEIQSANLYLTIKTRVVGQITTLYRITRDWDEATVSWSNAALGLPWSTEGGDYDLTPQASFYSEVQCQIQIDVTQMVQGWVNGDYPNYGFLMTANQPAAGEAQYSSREEKTGESPLLLIENFE